MKWFEKYERSVVKTITYRVLIIISTFLVSFQATGNKDLALGITSTATIVNTIIYFLHERIWNKIHWGKLKK